MGDGVEAALEQGAEDRGVDLRPVAAGGGKQAGERFGIGDPVDARSLGASEVGRTHSRMRLKLR